MKVDITLTRPSVRARWSWVATYGDFKISRPESAWTIAEALSTIPASIAESHIGHEIGKAEADG